MVDLIIENVEDIDFSEIEQKINIRKKEILKKSYEHNEVLDLRDKSITLVCASSVQILNSVKSVLNSMKFVKFTEVIFFSNKYYDEFNLFPKIVKIVDNISLNNILEYAKFIVLDLYKYINTKYFLIVQHDGTVLMPWMWTDKFLEYDYIGAPYPKRLLLRRLYDPTLVYNYPENAVGNGGFSLRTYKLAKTVAEKENIMKILNRRGGLEDLMYTGDKELLKYYKEKGIYIAPIEVAKNFSIELDYKYIDEDWFGAHSINPYGITKYYINNIELNHLMEKCKYVYG